jgi:prepilin-type N-terminal cleavage/methylation domain-containing protein
MQNPRRVTAFTLVELLAAIAILAILMSLIFGAYNQVARGWLAGEKRTESFQNVRLVLEMMGRELESAVASSNAVTGRKITFLSYANESVLPVSGSIPQLAAVATPNDQLFFVTSTSETAGTANPDLAERGYFVVFAKNFYQTMHPNRYYLIRHAANAGSDGFDIFSNPNNWFETPGFSTSTKVPILENVLRLEFRFQAFDSNPGFGQAVTNGTQITEEWNNTPPCPDSGLGGGCDACARPIDMVPSITAPEVHLPRAVHIRLAVMDRRNATRLAAFMAGNPGTYGDGIPYADLVKVIPNCAGQDVNNISSTPLATIIREGTHIFYKTVHLRNSR